MKTSNLLILIFAIFLTAACTTNKEAEMFAKMLTEHTGETHVVQKKNTLVDDYVVFKNEVSGEYVAYNLKNFKSKMSWDQYSGTLQPGDFYTNLDTYSQQVLRSYIRYYEYSYYYSYEQRWNDQTQTYETVMVRHEVATPVYGYYWDTVNYYTDADASITFSQEGSVKDLEKLGAVAQMDSISELANFIGAEYGLSQDRAQRVGQTLFHFNKVGNQREFTDQDFSKLSSELLGVELKELKQAYKKSQEGQALDYDSLIEKAARLNQISPEHAKKLMMTLFN